MSRNSSIPTRPPSRPSPDSLTPPNGAAGLDTAPVLTPTIPVSSAADSLAPEDFPYRHTIEGPDDMPGHVKASLTDSSLSVPVRDGRLRLGTWQGIYLCEHRRSGGSRRLVLTLQGELDS